MMFTGVASSGVCHSPQITNRADLVRFALGALGVVYGDIGTSPLYAVRECFNPIHGLHPTAPNILGILSLIFWTLSLVVVLKYMTFVMRADNQGDGGILALLALVKPPNGRDKSLQQGRMILIFLGLFGAALLWADGMITPAITVLSAIEGLEVATPMFTPYVVPIAAVILIALFFLQKHGTGGIGTVFGPIMLVWFVTIGVMGLPWILRAPRILEAINPMWALRFFHEHGMRGFIVLGAVVLCITGAEALYADMGHFGRRPIRFAWYAVVFPGLLLNYFGQGGLLILRGEVADENPFFMLAPPVLVYPLVVLATIAGIIASQALISGAFSLAQQAVQLGYSPRLTIIHTSSKAQGQIYIPEINTILMIACVGLVFAFQKSSNLAAAYGIAVIGTMAATSVLLAAVARDRWKWGLTRIGIVIGFFLLIDSIYFASNSMKVLHGGWFPLAVGTIIFAVMTTWKRGRRELAVQLQQESLPLDIFMAGLPAQKPFRVPGTGVFLSSAIDVVPVVLLHHYKHNKMLHENVLLLSIVTSAVPIVPRKERIKIRDLGCGFHQVVASYGFMQTPNVPDVIRSVQSMGVKAEFDQTSYYLGRENLLTRGSSRMWHWRKILFVFLSRNARAATDFFGLPPNRVVELGTQVEL